MVQTLLALVSCSALLSGRFATSAKPVNRDSLFGSGEGYAMQIERKIDSLARVVTLTVSGNLGDEELLGLADELAKAPEFERDFSLLIDLRQAHGQNVTSAGVRKLVKRPLVLSAESRRAVVVPSNLGFGMARMYEMLRQDQGGATRAFRDYDEAQRWITTSVR